MKFLKTSQLDPDQKRQLLRLWNNEYPRDLKYDDISELDEYLDKLEDLNHILLVNENDQIKGWYADFIRDDEKFFLAIVDSELQGKGYGCDIIEIAKTENKELNGWIIETEDYLKVNGQPYRSPMAFYRKLGFQVIGNIRLQTEKINAVRIRWARKSD